MHVRAVEKPSPALEPEVRTRASLLRRVCDWDDDASWQEFFNLYWKIIYSLAVQAGLTECEAEEVVQATMISVAKNIRSFNYDPAVGSFRRWICNQARWKISDCLRARRREQKRQHKSAPREPSGPGATHTRTATIARIPDEQDVMGELLQADWQRAVGQVALAQVKAAVDPKQFQMFDLYVAKKWPIREVARLLQVSTARVYLAKSRISRLLRQTTRKVEAQLERVPPSATKNKKPL
jgi:RNA polymerase sigma-70 factor (ECF subfamily)